jgi:cyclic pyranopterin phosphate synthase
MPESNPHSKPDSKSRSKPDSKSDPGRDSAAGSGTEPGRLSHLDERGSARMVDVSDKPVTRRVAEASCRVLLSRETVERLDALPKGDAYAVARLAGIGGAKRTGELIPLAHPLPLDQVDVDLRPADDGVEVRSRVVTTARTGAEMEALVACSTAALALYDMVKAVERGAVVTDLRLEAKSGGARGDYRRRDR